MANHGTHDDMFWTRSGTCTWRETKKQMSWQKKARPEMEGSWQKFERRTSNKKEERFNAAVEYGACSPAMWKSGNGVNKI